MSQRPAPNALTSPASGFFRPAAALALLSLATALPGVACPRGAATLAAPAQASSSASYATAELMRATDADAAEAWLTRQIPAGTALSEHPDFFAAANEAFYDAQDGLLIFVYRSPAPGRWVAWVSFDPERGGVVATTAADL